jgi:sugar phosphate permease
MAFGSGLSFWSFGLYVSPLEDQFGWSRAETSFGFSMALLVSGLISPLVGRWIDTRGPRSAIIVGGLFCSLTFLLLTTTQSLWQWYLFNAVNAIFRQMMFFIPFQTLISRWFIDRRGMALGILGTGFSLGGFLVVPIIRLVIDEYDWEGGFFFSAIFTALIFLPIGIFMVRNSPHDPRPASRGARPSTNMAAPSTLTGISLSQAIRLPLFWLLAIGLMMLFYGMFGWSVHQVPFWEEQGFSRSTGALFVSIAAGLGIFLRLAFGVISDRLPRYEYAGMAFTAFLAMSMITLLVSTSNAGIAIYLTLWVIGSSGGPLIEALLLTKNFGLAHFATILGTVAVIETIGQILSPTIAGAIFDSTGSYDGALIMFVGAFLMSFTLFAIASRLPRPVATPAEPRDLAATSRV